jgi:hypothetical protein
LNRTKNVLQSQYTGTAPGRVRISPPAVSSFDRQISVTVAQARPLFKVAVLAFAPAGTFVVVYGLALGGKII